MRRRSLSATTNRFEQLQARKGVSLLRALQQAGVDATRRGERINVDCYSFETCAEWPINLDGAWLELVEKHQREKREWEPCLAWPDGSTWSMAVPLASLDYLVAGPPLRHFAVVTLEAFAALVRGRQ
jgi:hypothetical protein